MAKVQMGNSVDEAHMTVGTSILVDQSLTGDGNAL